MFRVEGLGFGDCKLDRGIVFCIQIGPVGPILALDQSLRDRPSISNLIAISAPVGILKYD